MQERVTAAKLLQGHIADLLPSVLESIESVRDAENKEELQRKLTPWLAEEVASEIGQMIDSRDLLLEIVKEVLQHRAEMYAKAEADEESKDSDGNMWYIEEQLSIVMKFLVNIFMYWDWKKKPFSGGEWNKMQNYLILSRTRQAFIYYLFCKMKILGSHAIQEL